LDQLGIGPGNVVAENLPLIARCGLSVAPPQRRDDDDLGARFSYDAGAVCPDDVR
jgi:hypothetical protein